MKKQVSFSIKEDIQKNIPDDNLDNNEVKDFDRGESVYASVRKYGEGDWPVDLSVWIRENEPDENLVYGKHLKEQVAFVRDVIYLTLIDDFFERKGNPPMVVSTHVSKGVTLPVYRFNLRRYDMEVFIWSNFYTWIISVNSKDPVECDFMGVFDPKKEIHYSSCEGMPKGKVFDCYEKDHSHFTFEITFFKDVYVFFFLLKHYFDVKEK